MNLDFTLTAYSALLESLLGSDYAVQTFEAALDRAQTKNVILRHDVDKKPMNALQLSEIEYQLGIKASYYFRIVRQSFDENIIRRIAGLGHEIGYHYEDVCLAKGDCELAVQLFEAHLREFRRFYPVRTICMHGSPLEKWDNREIWKHIDYKNYGIAGEPYFDIDYDEVLYLTDTGRRWDGYSVIIRDKVQSNFTLKFRKTFEIMHRIKRASLPDKLMINIHPQRWSDNWIDWTVELLFQNLKNHIKRFIS